MHYLLDSNICIHLLRGRAEVAERISAAGWDNCHISEYTVAELCYGAMCSTKPEANLNQVRQLCQDIDTIPITESILEFARQKARLRRQGTMIDDADIFIGTTAVVHHMIMVTENVKHFSHLHGIILENWVQR